jgi:nitrous oxidase accessory protein
MYCDRAQIEGNRLLDNSVGIYTMYSNATLLRDNLIRGQRGPSGYALAFKDADSVDASRNVLVDNRVGIFLDGTPFSIQGSAHYSENILAFNDAGVVLLPAVHGNVFEANTFWENVEQVAVQGGGVIEDNVWRGNYWSDYTGFDADTDGVGDVPYHAERFFESLTDREPRLQALIYSPAVQTIELAATTFPIVRPQPKLSDSMPRMQPLAVPAFAATEPQGVHSMALLALSMIGLGVLCGGLAFVSSKGFKSLRSETTPQYQRIALKR